LADIRSVLRRKARTTPAGQWIRANGYHEFDLEQKRHPLRQDLDHAAPDHPVLLTHRTGHAHVLNSMALKLVGITNETGDPKGGLIDRDPTTGLPTGLVYEMGAFLAARIPSQDRKESEANIHQLDELLLSCGITTVHDASSRNGPLHLQAFDAWKAREVFHPRLYMMIGVEKFFAQNKDLKFQATNGGPVQARGVKIILDETTGDLHPSQDQLNEWVAAIHRAGQQAIIHAITPEAVASACTAVESALGRSSRQEHRHRIEHCSVCPPSLAKRIAELGIHVVTQPGFVHANGDRYLQNVPPAELPFLYPLKLLLDNSVHVVGSSDSPIGPVMPLTAIGAAVTRKSRSGAPVIPGQGVGVLDAIAMYTRSAARALFCEKVFGTLTPGKRADLVVLNGDLLQTPLEQINTLLVEKTIIDGRIVWQRS
jgi:predicted amidohydrolase YtcJ